MKETLMNAIEQRRSYYRIGNRRLLSDAEIEKLVETAVLHVPSAFNSQSARIVLLLGGQHLRLWEIVKDTLRKIVPAESFGKTEQKIDGSFASGQGTVLFFEDQAIVRRLQQDFPAYKDNFPAFSEHTSAMHQYALWLLLEDAGYGASLQHYNPLIDEAVAREWALPESWRLVAQMPFGSPEGDPAAKEFEPLENRMKVFR